MLDDAGIVCFCLGQIMGGIFVFTHSGLGPPRSLQIEELLQSPEPADEQVWSLQDCVLSLCVHSHTHIAQLI